MDNEPLRYITESEPSPIVEPAPFIEPPKSSRFFDTKILSIGAGIVAFILFMIHFLVAAPGEYPKDVIINVEKGETISGVSRLLDAQGAIKSESVFKIFLSIFGGARGLVAGEYLLESEQNAITLAYRFSKGRYDLKHVRVTIPEGFNSMEIANTLKLESRFTRLDVKEFEKLAAPKEGYLFPDTYFFLPNITAREAVDAMLRNYESRVSTIAPELVVFGKSQDDVIKMASIIEEEARTEESRRIIAGILWKRLEDGMPLQVDAAFAFVNGKKDSALLTFDDLKIDSPFNTYTNKGLPPTPIANPGLAAIKATITPIKTDYYYYLTDKEGNMRYAVTHDEHVQNKFKYLR
jgi:UPF0755 protein